MRKIASQKIEDEGNLWHSTIDNKIEQSDVV